MVDRIAAGRSHVDRVGLAGGLGHRAWLVRLLRREGQGVWERCEKCEKCENAKKLTKSLVFQCFANNYAKNNGFPLVL